MRRRELALLLFAALFLSGCAHREAGPSGGGTEPMAVLASVQETSAAPEPDLASLGRILLRTKTLQPDASGASLRLADLAGELLRWLEANPRGAEARRSMASLPLPPETGPVLHALRETAASLGEERWQAWLGDAGWERTDGTPSRKELMGLLDALLDAGCERERRLSGGRIRLEIFKNPGRFLNISPENRCRKGRILL